MPFELDETIHCNYYNRFGVGYHMTLVKGDNFNENRTISLMSEMVPTAKISSNVGAEMSYVLEEESSKQFKPLFEILEGQYKHRDKLLQKIKQQSQEVIRCL